MLPASALLLGGLLLAQEPPDTVPLFASAEPLELTVVTDLEALRRDRSEDPEERPGAVVLADGDTIEAEFRPRGNFRRNPANCSFPPLRLDVKRKSAEGTVFHGQDKLKIVAPCRPDRENWEQYVLLEYGVYQAFRLLTDDAFRVRLARITYVDVNDARRPVTRWAFFIEDEDVLAARMGGTIPRIPEGGGVGASYFDPRPTTLVALFQYMVGNTDWSAEALHNVKIVQTAGSIRPVPYDFDFSGVVNTPYAVPNPMLGTRSVKERVYRGSCYDPSARAGLLELFRGKRAELEGVFSTVTGLEEKRARDVVSYLKGFFDAIETDERAERRLFRDCLPVR